MPKRRWLNTLIDEYIGSIAGLPNNDEGRAAAVYCAQWMKDTWVKRGISSQHQQHNLITVVRHEIKQRLGMDHFALASMTFSPEQRTMMNHSTKDRTVGQATNPVTLSPRKANAIVHRATNLLISNHWADIACGLVMVTGRRHTEIMKTAQFELKSDFSVMLSVVQKRRGKTEDIIVFEIPTLCRAEDVLSAIAKLRAIVLTSNLTNHQVKNRYSEGVTIACSRHFSDMIPIQTGRDKLYPHLFQDIYGAIAIYYYCPHWVTSQEFKAYSQGYNALANAQEPSMRPVTTADYSDDTYVVEDKQGNRQKGIKLTNPRVQVLETFQRPAPEEVVVDVETTDVAPPVAFASTDVKPEPSKIRKKTTMADLSQFELITYSDAYQRAVERGYKGSKQAFKSLTTKQPDKVTQEFGVQRDRSIKKPTIDQPTWRDLLSPIKEEEDMKSEATSTALPGDLEWVRKLSTGIDFLSREIEVVRQERDEAKATSDRIQGQWETEKDKFVQELQDKEQQITVLHDRLEKTQAELEELKATYKTLEPILKLVGKAQTELEEVTETLSEVDVKEAGRQAPEKEVEPAVEEAKPKAKETAPKGKKAAPKAKEATPKGKKAEPESKEVIPEEKKEAPTTKKRGKASSTRKAPTPSQRKTQKKTTPKKEKPAPSKQYENLDPTVNGALDAIFDYNNASGRTHEEKWAISYPIMKDLLTQVGSATQSKIKAVFDARGKEIANHHKTHNLGQRHNRIHAGESISNVIKLK